jgi:hypothetical protein
VIGAIKSRFRNWPIRRKLIFEKPPSRAPLRPWAPAREGSQKIHLLAGLDLHPQSQRTRGRTSSRRFAGLTLELAE